MPDKVHCGPAGGQICFTAGCAKLQRAIPPPLSGSVCPINYLRGVRGKSAMRAWCFWPRTGPQVNTLGIHLRRGICADAEERVYIPAGPQVNALGIHF